MPKSVYSQKTSVAICTRIAQGESLTAICKDPSMPGMQTVQDWLAAAAKGREKYKQFLTDYTIARQHWADATFTGMIELAQSCPLDRDSIAKTRLVLDTKKWVLARMNPRKYGNRLDVTSQGEQLPPAILVEIINAPREAGVMGNPARTAEPQLQNS